MGRTFRGALAAAAALAAALPLGACRAVDPACAGRDAATEVVAPDRYRAMSAAERRADAARFDALARLCAWEP